jgi:basic membrane protein A
MKALKLGAALAVAGLLMAACGDDSKTSSTTAAAADTTAAATATTTAAMTDTTVAAMTDTTVAASVEKGQKIGLLYDVTGRGDKSFNDSAAAGLDLATKDYGIVGAESTPTKSDGSDRTDRLDTVVSGGNKLVVAVGFLWGDAVTKGADAHTDTKFAIVDSVVDKPNVRSMVFAAEQGSYLVGVAAALKTKTKHVGFIGGVQNDLIGGFQAGFDAGVKSVDPTIKIDDKYITQPPDFGGFNDAAKGKEIATGMFSGGADIVYAAAGASGTGMFQAAKEFSAKGSKVWGIGVDSDQYNTVGADLQSYVLTSALKKVDVAVYGAISDFVQGKFTGGVKNFDLASKGVDYATSGGYVDDIKDKLEAAKADIISGKVKVPTKPGA